MKILMLLSNGYDPDVRVEKEACSLTEAGHRVEILAWDRIGDKPVKERVYLYDVRRIGPRAKYGSRMNVLKFPQFWIKAYWQVLRSDADVVHCHDFDTFPSGFLGAKLRLHPKRVVYDAHESYGDLHTKMRPFVNSFEKLFCRFVDVIAVNELLAKRYKKATVIMNCARLDDYSKSERVSDKFTIVFIGGLSKRRGLVQMVQAVNQMPDCELFIFGSGKGENDIRAIAKSNVHLMGVLPLEDVPRWTMAADMLFALYEPGLNNNYSSPNKLFDAIAAGKPILVSDTGIMAEVVTKYNIGTVREVNADYIPSGIDFIRDNYKELSANARKAQKDFNWDNEAKKLVKLYGTN